MEFFDTRCQKPGPYLYCKQNETVMKATVFAPKNIHVCSCPNQHLLSIGDVCELCMGQVTNLAPAQEWPEMVHADPFDELYFEELETFYEDIEYAA